MHFNRAVGQELPGFDFPWEEETAQNVWGDLDLSIGYQFVWNMRHTSGAWHFVDVDGAREDKATGVAGYNGGVTITPDNGDCDVALTGRWQIFVTGTETASGHTRVLAPGARPTVTFSAA